MSIIFRNVQQKTYGENNGKMTFESIKLCKSLNLILVRYIQKLKSPFVWCE